MIKAADKFSASMHPRTIRNSRRRSSKSLRKSSHAKTGSTQASLKTPRTTLQPQLRKNPGKIFDY